MPKCLLIKNVPGVIDLSEQVVEQSRKSQSQSKNTSSHHISEPSSFKVRGQNYLNDGKKVPNNDMNILTVICSDDSFLDYFAEAFIFYSWDASSFEVFIQLACSDGTLVRISKARAEQ